MTPEHPRKQMGSLAHDSEKVRAANAEITILFAEDNSRIQELVAALLHSSGYNVIVAGDGREALLKARAFDGFIHLLLSDIDMPGMTGIELATQLSQERPKIQGPAHLRPSCWDVGAEQWLAVPSQTICVQHAYKPDS